MFFPSESLYCKVLLILTNLDFQICISHTLRPSSSIKVSISSFVLVQDYDDQTWSFFSCYRDSDFRKMPKKINIDISWLSNLYLFETTFFKPPGNDSFHSFLMQGSLSKNLWFSAWESWLSKNAKNVFNNHRPHLSKT